jgi:hypothetical protein
MSDLLCARPHVKTVDFRASRLVVGRGAGIDIGTSEGVRHLEMGEEVPAGVLNDYTLRCLYDAPVRAIETLDYALTIPRFREACARKGIVGADVKIERTPEPAEHAVPAALSETAEPEDANPSKVFVSSEELDLLGKKQLSDLCYKSGLRIDGTKQMLRDRLAAALERSVDRGKRTVGA